MNFMQDSLNALEARLPELEWKLNNLQVPLNSKTLPSPLYSYEIERTPKGCVQEIKADLLLLQTQTNSRSAKFLAERIQRKINVLVQLCEMHKDKKITQRRTPNGFEAIMTRQKWLHNLEEEVAKLNEQRDALHQAFISNQKQYRPQALLHLKAELGEAERRLTEAKETLARAIR